LTRQHSPCASASGAIKYEAGYLFGATRDSPRGAVHRRFEYELAFCRPGKDRSHFAGPISTKDSPAARE
jgi:hypothetical protein